MKDETIESNENIYNYSSKEGEIIPNEKENEIIDSTEIADLRILTTKIWIEIGSIVAFTLVFTLTIVLTCAILLLRKYFDFKFLTINTSIILGFLWIIISESFAFRSLGVWNGYCDAFASKLTEKYNKSVGSSLLLPVVARNDLRKIVLRTAILYYAVLIGFFFTLVIEYLLT